MTSTLFRAKADLVGRLRCAESHLGDITIMVERGVECQHIIPQILGVQVTLHEINDLIGKYYLADCLNELPQHSNLDTAAYERFLAEIIFLYQRLGRNSRSYFTERNQYDYSGYQQSQPKL